MVSDTTDAKEVENENEERDQLEVEFVDGDKPVLQNLHKLFVEQYRKQYINYKKWYYVSNKYKKRGNWLSWIELAIGLFLLLLLGGLITGLVDRGIVAEGIATDLLIIISVISAVVFAFPIIKAKEEWSIKAERYHRYGQLHQRLFYEIEFLIQTKFYDEEVGPRELRKDYEEILKRKMELNQASPQLATKMYKEVIDNIEIDTDTEIGEFRTVAEVRSTDSSDESSNVFTRSNEEDQGIKRHIPFL